MSVFFNPWKVPRKFLSNMANSDYMDEVGTGYI